MENIQSNIAKKKKINIVFCYFGLVILIPLLFMPMIFRIVFKNYGNEQKKDVVTQLQCKRGNERITSSFLNDKPQKISYQIEGNYVINDSLDDNENGNQSEQRENIDQTDPLLRKFLSYGSLTYDETENISKLSFNISVTSATVDYELIFAKLVTQEEYFRAQGYSCSQNTLSY